MDSKSIFLSKTFYGALLALAAPFISPMLAKYGVAIDADGWATKIAELVGLVVTLYGRYKAVDAVHVITPN